MKQPKQPKRRAIESSAQTKTGVYPLFPDLPVRAVRALRVSEFLDESRVESFVELAEPTADTVGLFNVFAKPEQRDVHFLVEALDGDAREVARTEIRYHSEVPPTGEGPAHVRDDGLVSSVSLASPVVVGRDEIAVPANASSSEVRTLAREASMLGHLDSTGRALTRSIEFANVELTKSFLRLLENAYGEETPRVRELRKICEDLRKSLDDTIYRSRAAESQYQQSVLALERQALSATRESAGEIVALQKKVMGLEIELIKARGDLEQQREETRQKEGVLKSLFMDGAASLAPQLMERVAQVFGMKLPGGT